MALSFEVFHQFLVEDLGVEDTELTVDTPLFSSSLIDSFSLMNLMQFVSYESDITVDPSEITLENFDSIAKIMSFVERKHAASDATA